MMGEYKGLQPSNKFKDFCHVNRTLLPFKLHFFFSFGGFAGVLPFMPIIGKQLGINATAIGIGYSMIPIFIFLTNPIIGLIVDYFQSIKVFLIVLLISSSAAYSSVLSLSSITRGTEDAAYVQVLNYNDSEHLMNISTPFDRSCVEEILKTNIQCEIGFERKNLTTLNDTNVAASFMNVTYSANESDAVRKEFHDRNRITFYARGISIPDTSDEMCALKSFRCSPSIQQCSVSTDTASVFSTYQFWAFFSLVIIGGITVTSFMTLSSVACCEILGTQIEVYGRQRLFATISWGLICTLAGILNDELSSTEKTFLPGFCLMALFLVIDVIILTVIYIPKAHISTGVCKGLGKIFSSKEILVFSLGISLIGFFQNIIAMYEFWFLEDMGASRTLLGLAVAMQCLVGEVPFLFFSGWFVKKFGHFLCFAGVFAGFGIRLLLYSFLKNPWMVLPVDTLHGVTFGIYHGAMTSFAKVKAPKGLEATLLGFFGGLADGLGYGLGSFVGGFGFDKLGARKTFFTASMLSLICLPLFLVASYVFRAPKKKEIYHTSPLEMEETLSNK